MEQLKNHIHLKRGFLAVFVIIIMGLLFAPMMINGFYATLFLQICFNLIILSLIYTISSNRRILMFGIGIAAPFVFFNWLSILYDSLPLMEISYFFFSAFLLFAIVILISKIFTRTSVDTNLVFGVLMIYLLSGLLWAKLYWLIDAHFPGSFKGISSLDFQHDHLDKALQNQFSMIYYSFTVLPSLGLGDILPVQHLSRSLTMLEAVYGQLFVAVAIAKMVTIWHMKLKNEKEQ